MPDLESLRLLVDVGTLGSLGRAARNAGISQPAASKRLTQLERDLQTPLVVRTATGSQLTAQGQAVADCSRRILDELDHLVCAVAALREPLQTTLRVAASMTVAEHLLPTWLSRVQDAHPDLHVGLEVANSVHVQELLLDRRADIGFVEGPTIDPRLARRRVAEDRLAVVVAPEHPWAGIGETIPRERLLSERLVVREAGSGTRATLDRALGTARCPPLLELGSNEAVKGAVLTGAGAAVLSVLAVDTELADGRLIEVSVNDVNLQRGLNAVWNRDTPLTTPSTWLLAAALP